MEPNKMKPAIIGGVTLGVLSVIPVVNLVNRVPRLSSIPAYLIGVGFRPEHAPDFARRRPDRPQVPSGS